MAAGASSRRLCPLSENGSLRLSDQHGRIADSRWPKTVCLLMDETTQIWEPFKRAPTQLTVIAGEPEMKN
jgi:hypothetical protein